MNGIHIVVIKPLYMHEIHNVYPFISKTILVSCIFLEFSLYLMRHHRGDSLKWSKWIVLYSKAENIPNGKRTLKRFPPWSSTRSKSQHVSLSALFQVVACPQEERHKKERIVGTPRIIKYSTAENEFCIKFECLEGKGLGGAIWNIWNKVNHLYPVYRAWA